VIRKNRLARSVRDPHNIVQDLPQRGVALRSIPCRSRGRHSFGRLITRQHHEREKPSNCPLAVRVGADRLGDVADRGGVGLDLLSLGAQSGVFGFQGWGLLLTLVSEHLAALAIDRRGCLGATALGRFFDDRIDLPPVKIGDGVSLDFGTRRKGCVLRLDGRLNRAPLAHIGGLRKELRLTGSGAPSGDNLKSNKARRAGGAITKVNSGQFDRSTT
jgi:hypothetical protein